MKDFLAKAPVIMFVLGTMGLAFLAGIYVTEKHLFPYPQIRDAYKTIKVIVRGSSGAGPYVGEVGDFSDVALADIDPNRFTFAPAHQGDNAGYLVLGGLNQFLEYCPDKGCLAVQFDSKGQVQRTVPFAMTAIFDAQVETGFEYEYVSLDAAQDIRPIGMVDLPDGDLLVTFQITRRANVFPYGAGVARVAPDGSPRWFRFDGTHHWPSKQTRDGQFLVPGTEIANKDISFVISPGDQRSLDCPEDRPYLDLVNVLSADGEIVESFNILEALIASPYRAVLVQTTSPCDPIHLNYVDTVGDDFPVGLNNIMPGDLVLSLRNISAFAFFRPETGRIVHLQRGSFVQQHSVQHVAGARFAMFDNLGGDSRGGSSRLMEIDLETGQERTVFPRDPSTRFGGQAPYSSEAGYVDLSPDRSRALVTFSYQGTTVEVDLADGREISRYRNLHDISDVADAADPAKEWAAVFQMFAMNFVPSAN